MNIFAAVLLTLVFLVSIMLDQAYRALPLKELKRRARSGHDAPAGQIYKMASYGTSLEILLWLTGSISVGLLIIMAAGVTNWLALALALAASWVFIASRHYHGVGSRSWRLASVLAPHISTLLSYLQPLLGRLALHSRRQEPHHNIFEKEDLVELLERQIYKPHNRLSDADLKLAAGALTFSDKKVVDIMQAATDVKFVSRYDDIGPLLMDELHQSGGRYFPVVTNAKVAKSEIIGTLYLKDIIGYEGQGKVGDVMKHEVNYINEAYSLHQVVNAFVKTQAHIFIVTNSFEEIIGVVTIDKLLEQITGQPVTDDDFDRYDNLLAVAGLETDQPPQKQAEPAEA